jgi:hypothetical protein
MIHYKPSYLEKWKNFGYRFIQILPREKYGVLRPLYEDKILDKGFTIEITEMNLLQVTESYFLILEKDAAQKGRAIKASN